MFLLKNVALQWWNEKLRDANQTINEFKKAGRLGMDIAELTATLVFLVGRQIFFDSRKIDNPLAYLIETENGMPTVQAFRVRRKSDGKLLGDHHRQVKGRLMFKHLPVLGMQSVDPVHVDSHKVIGNLLEYLCAIFENNMHHTDAEFAAIYYALHEMFFNSRKAQIFYLKLAQPSSQAEVHQHRKKFLKLLTKTRDALELEISGKIPENEKVRIVFDIKPKQVFIFTLQPPISDFDLARIQQRLNQEHESYPVSDFDQQFDGMGVALALVKSMLRNLQEQLPGSGLRIKNMKLFGQSQGVIALRIRFAD